MADLMAEGTCPVIRVVVATVLAGSFAATANVEAQRPPLVIPDAVRAATANGRAARVILELNVRFTPEGRVLASQAQAQRGRISASQNRILSRLGGRRSGLKRYQSIPFLALSVDAYDLTALQSLPDILSVQEDEPLRLALVDSVPLVGAPSAWAAGYTGTGWAVAVLDSGVQTSHPFFGGRVVAEACYSTDDPAGFYDSLCPADVSASTAVGSGQNCSANLAGCDHGTHVAGIVAGSSGGLHGVATGAQLIAIQVGTHDLFDDSLVFFDSDVIRGLERVYALRHEYNIAAANLSLGGGAYTSACDAAAPAFKSIIDTLASVNIATIAASGNDGYTNAISRPACVSTAVSVGATTKSDEVAPYTNSAPFLDLLAPGSAITSSVPVSTYGARSGTSMAVPHVAGAWALLKHRNPDATVNQILAWLQQTGQGVFDRGNSLTRPRIRVDQAIAVACALAVSPDTLSFQEHGGTATLNVTTGFGCAWSAITTTPWLTITSGASGSGSGSFTVTAGPKRAAGTRTGTVQVGVSSAAPVSVAQSGGSEAPYDVRRWNMDGDTRTDVAVWRPGTGTWYTLESGGGRSARDWGGGWVGDQPVPGDYDGDGVGDFAVWRPGTGVWYILRSGTGFTDSWALPWGGGWVGDIPVPADYDGDGKTDLAVWRPSSGTWFVKTSSTSYTDFFQLQWGDGSAGDVPVAGDYDGDGRADIAVWRAPLGTWFILRSHLDYARSFPFITTWGSGSVGDQPVPGDYDGDGAADIAVWRGPTGFWYLLSSAREYSPSSMSSIQWGTAHAGDQPIIGDYDGDGRSDLSVWRGPTGVWYVRTSSSGFRETSAVQWGSASVQDVPLPR